MPKLAHFPSYNQNHWPACNEAIPEIEARPFFGRREYYSLVGGCKMIMDRVVVPTCSRKRMLKRIRQGHSGIERSKAIARGIMFWPRIDNDIEMFRMIASAAKSPPQANPQPWPTADGPWQHLHLDFAGPKYSK